MTPDPRLLPRLLAGIHGRRALSLVEHETVHGRAPRSPDLAGALEAAGLRGRGGALFPTATKIRAVAAARGRPIVVVNAAEGEPMSAKDRVLLEAAPHLVLDGARAAAHAVGAKEIVIGIPGARAAAHAALTTALRERDDARHFTVEHVPDLFLAGEETALLQALMGRAPRPTTTPPLPAERGLRRRPTLVQNAETLAQLALVARHGPEWFRALGTPDHPGSTLVTLGGGVHHPGVYEIAAGTPLGALLDEAGDVTEPVRAVLVGGYHGGWVDGAHARTLPLDRSSGQVSLGAGVIVVLGQSACPIAEVSRVVDWLADQSAGQCGPCVHGLAAIADEVSAVRTGSANPASLRRLRRWGEMVSGRGACRHPDGAVRFLAGALHVFEAEFELHRRFGACEACARRPVLSVPASPLAVAA